MSVSPTQLAELTSTWHKLASQSDPLLPNDLFLLEASPTPTPTPTSTSASATASAALSMSTSAASSTTSIQATTESTPPLTEPKREGNAHTPVSNAAVSASTPAPAVSRRTHPKSRTGCRTCKVRKIKCDEARPSCRNCIRHGVKCPYTTPPASVTPHGTLSATSSPTNLSSSIPVGLTPGLNVHGGHELNLIDLELLHNWTTSTYATLSEDSIVRDVWRITVVRLGVQRDFVMRTILAVSALHMAHHRTDKRDFYFSKALTYHQMASQAATPLLGNLATSSEGWEHLYLFSILTVFFSLGSTKQQDMMHTEAFPPWIYLLSGARSLVHLAWLRLDEYQGPLAPLFRHGRRRWDLYQSLEHSAVNTPELIQLQQQIIRSVTDPVSQSVYLNAIGDLARNIKVMSIPEMPCIADITDAFVWVFSDMDNYLAKLRCQTQESIAI